MTIEQAPQDVVDTGGIDPVIYRRRWIILGAVPEPRARGRRQQLAERGPAEVAGGPRRLLTQLQRIVDAYSIVSACLLLPSGALGDRFGRKGALQLGLATVGLASLLSTFAHSANQLIGTRALMGVGAAFVMPATLSILANVFPPGERARAIAIWAGFAGAGAAIGPVLSGFLLGHYRGSVFFVNVPIAIARSPAPSWCRPRGTPTTRQARPDRRPAVGGRPGLAVLRHHRGAD
jgi:MFS family permease